MQKKQSEIGAGQREQDSIPGPPPPTPMPPGLTQVPRSLEFAGYIDSHGTRTSHVLVALERLSSKDGISRPVAV